MRSAVTTRDRILRVAVERFATDGMGASLRSIAADAGVSAALILHHFGSRTGLREACDELVLTEIRESKTAVMDREERGAALLVMLAQAEGYAALVGYVLRRLQEGGRSLQSFVDQVVADTEVYLRAGEEAGVIRPTRFPRDRARYLTEQSLGALLLQLPGPGEPLDLTELPRWMRDYTERTVGPALEGMTEPILTDSTLLDIYLARERP